MKRIKVIIIEPSSIIATGFAEILQSGGEFEVATVLEDMSRITERMIVHAPDLLVLDPQVVDYSKRMTFRSSLQDIQVPVVALVRTYCNPDLYKHFDAVIDIQENKTSIEEKLRNLICNSENHVDNQEVYELSEREIEVLIALAKGMTNKEIATLLHISVHTVISHRKNIIRKTGIKSVAGLTVYAMLNNLMKD